MFDPVLVSSPIIITFVVVGFILSFLLAFGVGANDVANFFGTVVGTNTLKLYQVFIIASIFEFSGSLLLGYKVSDTIRKKIINVQLLPCAYPDTGNCRRPVEVSDDCIQPQSDQNNETRSCSNLINMEISISSLLGSSVWLLAANVFGLPVSTTHSIVGSTIGAGLVALGKKSIEWKEVGKIVASWVISPLVSGAIAGAIYYLIYKIILKKVIFNLYKTI